MTYTTTTQSITPDSISVVDSRTEKVFSEKVWGKAYIDFLYAKEKSLSFASFLRFFIVKSPFISRLWGIYNNMTRTKQKIIPFCTDYNIDQSEFETSPSNFTCFNDFFTRRLLENARPINQEPSSCIAPADARYTFIPNLGLEMPFTIKGTRFQLASFLKDPIEAARYEGGTLIIARLCPIDCHRYVFPTSGSIIDGPKEIKGALYSVSPVATSTFPWIWWENKRVITTIKTPSQMCYSMVEVGATNCGTIVQTFSSEAPVEKGMEKGYFKLGGSAIILIFPKGQLQIDEHLIRLQQENNCEVYCQYGQKLGTFLA